MTMKLFNEYQAEKAAIEMAMGEFHSGGDWTYSAVCQAHQVPRCPQEKDLDACCNWWAVRICDEAGQLVGHLGS
jgi:hypothetical protein